MKKVMTGLMLVFAVAVQGQEFKMAVKGNAADTWVEINRLSADITIEGTSGGELRIVAKDYEGMPEKAQGLKPLSAFGPENTGIGLSVLQEGSKITISGTNNKADQGEYVVYLPKSLNLRVDYHNPMAGDVTIKGMAGQVEAKAFSNDLELVDVTGPIIAHTLSSDLNVRFTTVSQASPSSLTSTSGDIEITLPATSKGTFNMSTMTGGVYSDLDFKMSEENSEIRRIGGTKTAGTLNGGGVEISLKTISGDIYIRKGN